MASAVVSHIPSLELAAGKSIGIVGESGSGKSSALMAMLGLSSTTGARPTGSVLVSGVNMLADTPRRAIHARLGYRAHYAKPPIIPQPHHETPHPRQGRPGPGME